MAFSFGNTSFGQATNKPTGFGTAFGAQAPTTSAPAFSNFGSTFGATSTAPTFGSTFGAPVASTAPTFGTSFGAVAPTSAPTFGSTFGQTATTAAPTFGSTFGTPASSSLFGAATTKPSFFGSQAGTTPAAGGANLFGGSVTTQAPSLFGGTAVAPTAGAPSLFGTTTTTPSLFGSSFGTTTTTSTPSLFGGGGTTGSSGFGTLFSGTTTTSTPSLFGGGFGAPATTTTSTGFGGFGGGTGFGGFGGTTAAPNLFGSKPAVPSVQPAISKNQQIVASVYGINVFNDERDDILKKWNMLQASWGIGKGYYNNGQPPVEYAPQNPFYRFKTIGYNIIPEQDNSDGVVKLVFMKKLPELKSQTDMLKNGIAGILGNRPNLTVEINQMRSISDTQTELRLIVSEKGVTGSNRKIAASDLAAFLNQPSQKQQLTNVGVIQITPMVTPSKSELEEYLKNPPSGIESNMWQAAIADNPNPKKYIPVAVNGFSDLRLRMLHQETQTGLHQAFFEKVNKDINELKTKHASSHAQITELKQKFMELQHRILRIIVRQESSRKVGLAIQPEEELMRGRLEIMHNQLNAPKQFKGQINELLSFVKMISCAKQTEQTYRVDSEAQDEIKEFLTMEQNGINQLVSIVNSDLQAIKIMNDGMQQMLQNNVRL